MTRCWCGETDAYFDPEVYGQTCGGSGVIDCYCGGDFCVCHHHGEIQCDGCPDCRGDDDSFEDEDYQEFISPADRERQAEIAEQERTMWAEYEREQWGMQ